MSNDWTIYSLESGNTYILDALISRPNADLETLSVSNLQVVKLANGEEAFIQPETKYYKDTFTMLFIDTSLSFRNLLGTYIVNGDKIKILTHTGQIFYGYFMSIKRVWLVGMSPDQYDVTVQFKETIS